MFLFEFNNLDLEDKYNFVWRVREGVNLNCFLEDGDYKYVLFDCETFFAEACVSNGKNLKVKGFEPSDYRINLYLNWLEENKDDLKYQLLD